MALGLVVVALLFLADILFVVTSRAALLVVPLLLLLLAWKEFRWKGVVAAVALGLRRGGGDLVRFTLSARSADDLGDGA